MAKLTVDVPENLKRKLKEFAKQNMTNSSQLVRKWIADNLGMIKSKAAK